ncbi:hypothetical protein IQ235_12910 [Oscillatoriales cyanobacterium LEGE 11467]|uniref:Uncharacterized protein n=1 Tax=Zarconia navalis LEGE 11467 TaxID=1828826 RepID=A0A928ZAG6_9CYAN|nr:hypothetical protein [Zarconia navalis]MBE9041681.1 hypothetical protein [Zarconia navalis LEGE 11467]
MLERTEPVSHFSILFKAFIFTVLVALMSGGIETKTPIKLSEFRSFLKGYSSGIAEMTCQQNACNLSDYVLRESDENLVLIKK